jgi:hypothetical protein
MLSRYEVGILYVPNAMPGSEEESVPGIGVGLESLGGITVESGGARLSPGTALLSVGAVGAGSVGWAASVGILLPSPHACPTINSRRMPPDHAGKRHLRFILVDKPIMSVASSLLGASTQPV